MSDPDSDRRDHTRAPMDLPVAIQQGGSVWQQRLLDISLAGVATDQPATWDAQYNEPFTLLVGLADGRELELHAYLQHVEDDRLGFTVERVDRANIEPLRELLAARVDDAAALEAELARLQQGEG